MPAPGVTPRVHGYGLFKFIMKFAIVSAAAERHSVKVRKGKSEDKGKNVAKLGTKEPPLI